MKSGSERPASGRLAVHVAPEISDIVPIFLEHMNQDLKTMQGALHSGDYETIRILGHSMTGAGGGFGFDALTD